MKEFNVPHIDLSDDEKSECMAIMRRANGYMKEWAEDYFGNTTSTHRFRRGLLKWKANPEDPQAINPAEAGIPPSVFNILISVQKIESKVMFGYVKMVARLARRFMWAVKFTYLDLDDLLLEGFMALRDAMYSFSNEEASFTTYAYVSIRHRLFSKIWAASDRGVLGVSSLKLLDKYYKCQRTLEKKLGYIPSLATIAEEMGLSSEEADQLESLFRRCIHASDLMSEDEGGNPYENIGKNPEVPDLDMVAFEEAIQTAEMSDIERELIQAAVSGEKNFRSRIIGKYINPKTQAPYSRMSATNMLRRAYKIVCQELKRQETVAA